jgi:DNA replication protein DnaC
MALTNAQYQIVMREYEQQQLKNRHEQEARIAEIYENIPQIRSLDEQVAASGAACARRTLNGDSTAREELRAELVCIREQKQKLLRQAGYPADYMEMRYRCRDCRDTGFADGRRCHCFERARIRILYDQSNLRKVLDRENFSTLSYEYYDDREPLPRLGITQRSYMEQLVKRCREFAAAYPEDGRNLLFTGSTGVGKTFLTNCIAKELIDRYVSVICLSSQDLFDILSRYKFSRDAEEETEETYHHILDCDMLIIDDLGTEMNNTFVSSQLFYCIDKRISLGRGTIISTNLSMDILRDLYSDRVMSRIRSNYSIMPLYGADIRMKKRQRGLE